MCDFAPRQGFDISRAIIDACIKHAGLLGSPNPDAKPRLTPIINLDACFTMVEPVKLGEGT